MIPGSRKLHALLPVLVAVIAVAMPHVCAADVGLPALTVQGGPGGGQTYTLTLQVLVLMTALSLLPAILLMMTAFTRIVIVLGLLRQAIGAGQTPPNQVLIGLSLFLTLFVMAPVVDRINDQAVKPYMAGTIDSTVALTNAIGPLKTFMLSQVGRDDLALFVKLSKIPKPATAQDIPIRVVTPAFMISELKRAFEIGFLLFVPFLVIDLVVASVLMSMGMMMLPPVVVSLPFKLIFFVLVDGWRLVAGSLVQSFQHGPGS